MHRWPSYPYIINDDVDRNLVNLDTIIVWIRRTSVIQSFTDSVSRLSEWAGWGWFGLEKSVELWTWSREFVPLKHKNAGIRWRDSTNLPWICQVSPLDSVYSRATWPIWLISILFGNSWPRFWSYSGHDNSKLNSIPVQRSKIQFRREIIANNCSMNLTFWPSCKIIRNKRKVGNQYY